VDEEIKIVQRKSLASFVAKTFIALACPGKEKQWKREPKITPGI
jgi:hypothetical protein